MSVNMRLIWNDLSNDMPWLPYTPVNRDDLSNDMATGKLSNGSPIRVRSKLAVINVSFSAFIFRPVMRLLLLLSAEAVVNTFVNTFT